MSNFQRAMTRRPSKNAFNLSHERKQTMNMADLVPFYVQEVIPGDSFRVKSEVLMRLSPLVSPVMHRVNVTTHYFFCPNRILWDDWQNFITGGEDGADASVLPQKNIGPENSWTMEKKTLWDYMGLPVVDGAIAHDTQINELPFRAYQMIYNEYYRDQNLQDKIAIDTSSAENGISQLMVMRQRNWEKDYFTSALPFAQKGQPVTAPIGLTYDSNPIGTDGVGNNLAPNTTLNIGADGAAITAPTGSAFVLENIDPDQTGINIEDLRTAVRLQEWLEKNARAGSRYIESIMAHFGERVPDYTAQRPVFLGGGKQPVTISEVLQTGQTTVDGGDPHTNFEPSPQGNMAGHGISVGKTNGFNAKFTEHGFIIGIMSVLPRTAYQQGKERFWDKTDKFQYFWPEFAQLGEQEVLNKEVYMDTANPANDDLTFGYQSRYAEYKYTQSKVAGDFRDNLAFWHLGRIFDTPPALNSTFITANPREDIFAIEDETEDHLYVQIYNDVKAVRPIPIHNVPTL